MLILLQSRALPDFSLLTHIPLRFGLWWYGSLSRTGVREVESPSAFRVSVYLAVSGRFSATVMLQYGRRISPHYDGQLSMTPTPSSPVTMRDIKSLFLLRYA